MVRTQLYLPEELYINLKELAEEKGLTFAALARFQLEKALPVEENSKSVYEKYPFLNWAERNDGVDFDFDITDNEELDKAIYGF